MGQRGNELGEGDLETGAGERVCLQTKKKEPRFYVIKSNRALTILTRLVFVVLTLFSAGVITTSIWLMLECRANFAAVRPMLPRNMQFCTNMGMPALFACCTVLFAVFGLGCTGRRLTGYALIIISSVEILQSVTALTFYKCNAMSRQEVLGSVNTSLIPCYNPDKFSVPFVSYTPLNQALPLYTLQSFRDFHRPSRRTNQDMPYTEWLGTAALDNSISQLSFLDKLDKETGTNAASTIIPNARNRVHTPQEVQVPSYKSHTPHNIKLFPPLIKRDNFQRLPQNHEQIHPQQIDCKAESGYFWNLPQKLKTSEVSKCVEVCKAYQAVCTMPDKFTQFSGTKEALVDNRPQGTWHGQVIELSRDLEPAERTLKTILNDEKTGNTFDNKVEECGYKVLKFVSDLCYYDNKIILPISLCAPFLCIGMSACFIYLAYCDRRLKEDSQSNVYVEIHEASQSKSCIESFKDNCRRLHNCLRTRLCHCPPKGTSAWRSLVFCRHCASTPSHLDSECFNSSHELLHLSAMPPNVTAGGALSPAVSQYTLNTVFTDDCSPILP